MQGLELEKEPMLWTGAIPLEGEFKVRNEALPFMQRQVA